MPRDYATKKTNKRTKRGASRSSKKPQVPAFLWVVTLFSVSGLIAALVYIKWFNPNKPEQPTELASQTAHPNVPLPKSEKSQTDTDQVDEVPFYEVHRDLTTKSVEIPQEDLKLPDNYKNYYYTMPCGSFRDPARAEELKALIALAGSNSEVLSVNSRGETWHRVQLGPFNSKRTAERTRHRLQDNGIYDCKINAHQKDS